MELKFFDDPTNVGHNEFFELAISLYNKLFATIINVMYF